ncbi:MAG: cytochrome C biogenesis protein [Chloroflexota bacterium]
MTETTLVPPTSPQSSAPRPLDRRRIVFSVGLALAILVAAWFVSGKAGLDQLGRGGINQKLLPRPGEPAPDFTAVDIHGNIVSLSDFKGKPVWLNFWGTWCPPCRAEMPDMQAAYEQLAPKGLVLLAVSLGDPPGVAADFASRNGVTFTVLLDPQRTFTSQAYPIYNFPTHIFIDRDGIVRKVVLSVMSPEEAIANASSVLDD